MPFNTIVAARSLPALADSCCRYNAAVEWGRQVGGVAEFLERVIGPVIKSRCARVQLVVCSDDAAAAVTAVVGCLEGGPLSDWARMQGSIVNAAQLCGSSCVSACPFCSVVPSHHLDFALLSRCHWALVSNSTFGTASRM
jgi:hypothetical protein